MTQVPRADASLGCYQRLCYLCATCRYRLVERRCIVFIVFRVWVHACNEEEFDRVHIALPCRLNKRIGGVRQR